MTPDELSAIEARANDPIRPSQLLESIDRAEILQLVAEVRRLQAELAVERLRNPAEKSSIRERPAATVPPVTGL